MKSFKLISSAALLAGIGAMIFFGCQKDAQKTSANIKANTLKGPGGGGGGGVTAPDYILTFSPNPGVVGSPFTASVSLGDTSIHCGQLTLEQAQYNTTLTGYYNAGDPAPMDSVGSVASWVNVGTLDVSVGPQPLTYTYTPTVSGLVGYRAHYIPQGGQCGYSGKPSTAVNAVIGSAACTEGLFPQLVSAQTIGYDAKGTIWQFTVTFTINECTSNHIGKLQGGLIAGSTILSATPGNYSVSNTAKSNVITWNNVGGGIYTVVYTAHLAPGTSPITGAWSFKYPGGQYGYTSPVTFNF